MQEKSVFYELVSGVHKHPFFIHEWGNRTKS